MGKDGDINLLRVFFVIQIRFTETQCENIILTYPARRVNGMKNQCGGQTIENILGNYGVWNKTLENNNFTVFGYMNDSLDSNTNQVFTMTMPIIDRANPLSTKAIIGVQYRISEL